MVIQFGVSNFLVYFEPTLIQFSTNSKENKFSETDCVGNRFYNCLRFISVFGSNASGKSSIIKSVNFFVEAIKNNDLLLQSTNKYCRNKKEHQDLPSNFEIVIEIDSIFYQYGFSVLLKTGKILDEYLNKITPSTKASVSILDRTSESINLDLSAKTKKDVYYRLEDSIQRNILFLSNIGSLLKMSNNSMDELKIIEKVYKYITEKIIVIDKNVQSRYLFDVDEVRADFVNYLREFDSNIESIQKQEVDASVVLSSLPSDAIEKIRKNIYSVRNSVGTLILNNVLYAFKSSENGVRVEKICFKHFNSENEFDYLEESDGTLRIIDFIPILFLYDDVTFFIDEIEQSLSSDLVVKFIDLLRENTDRVQLLFTTHLDRLFDRRYLRKDEIYIVDKNNKGESHFTRFNQFENVDKVENINSKFLDGRYGGRPNIY